MIAEACETAVNCALSVHRKVASPVKKRKVTFHTPQGDETLEENDLQEQVKALKLYRENKKGSDNSSSDSSSESDS